MRTVSYNCNSMLYSAHAQRTLHTDTEWRNTCYSILHYLSIVHYLSIAISFHVYSCCRWCFTMHTHTCMDVRVRKSGLAKWKEAGRNGKGGDGMHLCLCGTYSARHTRCSCLSGQARVCYIFYIQTYAKGHCSWTGAS